MLVRHRLSSPWRTEPVYGRTLHRKLDYASCACRENAFLVCHRNCGFNSLGSTRLGTDFLYRPALLLCVRGNYVPHYLCSFTERAGQSHQACFILSDDVSVGGSRSVADGLCCRLLNHEYGFHCSLPWLCGGMAVCPPHVAGERISCVVFYTPTLHCFKL